MKSRAAPLRAERAVRFRKVRPSGLAPGGFFLGKAQALPMKMPVSSTRMPPSTTWTMAEVNGVSM